ncbi:hypothetical protein [Paraburkholderia sp. GAS32]|uniref:hypothetical protein n=1 Tax=Paraburkholderia sp. GAS32 TaxID=3035129 RepID=UPI003D1F25E8
MAKTTKAANATKTAGAKKAPAKKARAKKAALPLFDPASIPVMHYELHSFKTVGRSKLYKRIVEIGGLGIGAAALLTNEKDAPRLLAEGKTLAYAGEDLCVVTTDMALIESVAKETIPAEFMPNAMAFYRDHVGRPFLAEEREYENVSGTPYGLYRDCMDEEDFAIVNVEMAAKYERILAANAHYALSPLGEPGGLFDEHVPGRTLEAAILNFVVAAHEHDKYAKEWHDVAIEFSKVWKAKHGLSKVDHACPRYRAFTRAPWMQHKYHRGLAALARSYLSGVTERYAQASEVPFCASAHALSKKVAPQPLKLVPAKLPRLEEMDDSIPF